MIKSKKINIIVLGAVTLALIISLSLVVVANIENEKGNLKTELAYESKIFGTEIISIDILANESDWQEMLDNAINEEFIMVDVIVNGKKFKNVGIRPKGNSSLTQVVNSDSDRYSFRLQFNEYIKGQTCFGLESFVINNIHEDSTYMKEYISYEIMKEIGVDTPYFNYADIKVNGEGWGLYLAVELYNSSYEQRVFGDTSGMLYNVKSMDMGGNERNNFPQNMDKSRLPDGMMDEDGNIRIPDELKDENGDRIIPDEMNNRREKNFPPEAGNIKEGEKRDGRERGKEMNLSEGMGGKGFAGGRGSSGGSLEYTDDRTESYSAIFDNVVGKGKESDFQRVIKALKALSEGEDLEEYFDIDQILRYLAAHTVVVNLDSYSSSMAQNYYIYEKDGKLTILPWDYNLAWGGFQSNDATSVINFPIDTPLSGVEMSSRPLIEKLFSNTEYLERYHSYLQEIINKYFDNNKFEEKINTLDKLISSYVENDATAFCSFEEYKAGISTLIKLGNLRAQSIQGQLDGSIPSTNSGQEASPDLLVSGKDINLSDLGTMMGGRGGRPSF